MIGNLYLTGFMGSGKSTLGRELAARAGREFVDVDELIAWNLGMSIKDAFASRGEDFFRERETGLLAELAGKAGLVVATGGGVPGSAENRELMRQSGTIVHLDVDLATCRSRVTAQGPRSRPLWDEAKVKKLFQARREAYQDCHLNLAATDQTPELLCRRILESLLPETNLTLNLGGEPSGICCTFKAAQRTAGFSAGRKAVIIHDRRLTSSHLPRYRAALPQAPCLAVPPGERSKSLSTVRRLYSFMQEHHLERGDMVIALGGGTITDLTAFAASTFKRGVGFLLAATTLLACVDAAIGGKAALNLGQAKNLIGSFTCPEAVVLDLWSLTTLDRGLRAEGLVEAYKTGLVADPGLATLIELESQGMLHGDLDLLCRVVKRSARAKAEVVSRDFTENGMRRILNLGHTYGHAVEAASGFSLSHGQAVAAGICVAAALSRNRRLMEPGLAEIISQVMLPLAPPPAKLPNAEQAWKWMSHDKKNQGGKVIFILLEGQGRPLVANDVTPAELDAALTALKEAGGV